MTSPYPSFYNPGVKVDPRRPQGRPTQTFGGPPRPSDGPGFGPPPGRPPQTFGGPTPRYEGPGFAPPVRPGVGQPAVSYPARGGPRVDPGGGWRPPQRPNQSYSPDMGMDGPMLASEGPGFYPSRGGYSGGGRGFAYGDPMNSGGGMQVAQGRPRTYSSYQGPMMADDSGWGPPPSVRSRAAPRFSY